MILTVWLLVPNLILIEILLVGLLVFKLLLGELLIRLLVRLLVRLLAACCWAAGPQTATHHAVPCHRATCCRAACCRAVCCQTTDRCQATTRRQAAALQFAAVLVEQFIRSHGARTTHEHILLPLRFLQGGYFSFRGVVFERQ